jgi:hypothetical protein
MRKAYLSFALLVASSMGAEDFSPWYPPAVGIEVKADYFFQTYPSVASSHGSFSHHADDQFFTLSAATSYDIYAVEAEMMLAHTRKCSFMVDHLGVTGRYQFLSDTLGDDFSLVAGLTLIKPFDVALNDISCFHHGHTEGEFTLALGHESICKDSWISRWWTMAGFGIADIGSPWIRGEFTWEQRWYDVHMARFFVHSLLGFGKNALHTAKHFHGYGPIRHRSLDVGVGYDYSFDHGIMLEFDYAYRVYARNFPKNASLIQVVLTYPFSL